MHILFNVLSFHSNNDTRKSNDVILNHVTIVVNCHVKLKKFRPLFYDLRITGSF